MSDITLKYKVIRGNPEYTYVINVQYSWGDVREYHISINYDENPCELDERVIRIIRAFRAWDASVPVFQFGDLPIGDILPEEEMMDEFQDLISQHDDTVAGLGSPTITSITYYGEDGDAYAVTVKVV